MEESGQGKRSRLFARPGALLVDQRPQRIDLPSPPPLTLRLPDVPSEPPPEAPAAPEPEDEPLAGPARLFVGAPRAVSPTAVRAGGGSSRLDEEEPTLRDGGFSGLDRSARTVAEDVDGRRERERRERSRGRGAAPSAWEALAQEPAAPHGSRRPMPEPEAQEEAPRPAAQVIPRAAEPEPTPIRVVPPPARTSPTPIGTARPSPFAAPRARTPVPKTMDTVSSAEEDEFFGPPAERPTISRPNNRRLQPGFPGEDSAPQPSQKFVPRNQRLRGPRHETPSWAVILALGLLLVGGSLMFVAWRIRGPVAESLPAPALVEPLLREAPALTPPPTTPIEAAVPAVATDAPTAPTEPPAPPGTTGSTPPVATHTPGGTLVDTPSGQAGVVAKVSGPAGTTGTESTKDGVLYVVVDEPARVRVDGRSLGVVTGRGTFPLKAGMHAVRIVSTRSGRTQSLEVRIDAGRSSQVGFKLK